MKIIDHSGDQVRQIVPQDMSFLSDVDQQIAAAIGGMIGKMFGVTNDMAVVMEGMERYLVQSPSSQVGSSLTISEGVVLHRGRLYSFGGGTVESTGRFTESYATRFCLKFTDSDTVAPSPVYGATIEQTVNVHKELKAVLAQTAEMTEADDYVVLNLVKVIPQVASANAITASLIAVADNNEEQV